MRAISADPPGPRRLGQRDTQGKQHNNSQHAIADPLTLPHQHISSGSIHRREQSPKQNRGTPVPYASVRGKSRAKRRNGPSPKRIPLAIVNGDAVLVEHPFRTHQMLALAGSRVPALGMRLR